MTDSLNIVALISGGKDSFYSLLHCIQNGHNIIALANLHPPLNSTVYSDEHGEEQDIESFMYQTVGHSVVPLYAEALDLPLYRRAITGSAVQTGRYYDSSAIANSSVDETEDLVPLLNEVMRNHPEVNAVSTGAILSTYQRTRIESIALRLKLIPLAYLWQYPVLPPPKERGDSVTGLLDDMQAAGCDARLVKIASGGITESMLWKNVAEMKTKARLVSGMAPFFPEQPFWLRGAILGEGGEYETLAINGPPQVWKKRIVVDESQTTTVNGDGGAYHVKLPKASLTDQEPTVENASIPLVRTPKLLDFQFHKIKEQMPELSSTLHEQPDVHVERHQVPRGVDSKISKVELPQTVAVSNTAVMVANITTRDHSEVAAASEQMSSICSQIPHLLYSISVKHQIKPVLSPSDIVSTTLLLSSMSDFATVNPIYASMFRSGEPNPPARVTVATGLPVNIKISLSIIVSRSPREYRRGLHVQSRSYWAPANIGPYSQAVSEPFGCSIHENVNVHDASLPEIVHMAGQIPLLPQSMGLVRAPFDEQALLSLQHLWRVGQERGVDIWPWGIAFLYRFDNDSETPARTAAAVWKLAHLNSPDLRFDTGTGDDSDDENVLDAWDMLNDRSKALDLQVSALSSSSHLHALPNWDVLSTSGTTFVPPFIAAEVSSLPRAAPVEWWSTGLADMPKGQNSSGVRMVTQSKEWGEIGVVEVPAAVPETSTEMNFVTLLIYKDVLNSHHDLPSLQTILLDFFVSVNGNSFAPDWKIAYGSAFVSEAAGRYVQQHSGDWLSTNGVVQIPCRSIFGIAMSSSTVNTLPSMEPLCMAFILRVDTTAKSW